MLTARLLTNCSSTLRNIHTDARENITRTRTKGKADYFFLSSFGGLEVACWPLVPKFAGSNPAEAVGFLRVNK